MWTPTKLHSGQEVGYGLGWNIDRYEGHRCVGHQDGVAMSNFTRYLDAGLTVILLTNLDSYQNLERLVAMHYLPVAEPGENAS